MSIKAFCVAGGAVASILLGILPPLLGVPWWWHALAVAVCAGLALLRGREDLQGHVAFGEVRPSVRERWAAAYTAAVSLHVVWIAVAWTWGWRWSLPVLAAMAGAEWATASWWEHRITKIAPSREVVAAGEVLDGEIIDEQPLDQWETDALAQAVLTAVGRAHYRVLACEDLPYGVVWRLRKLPPFLAARDALEALTAQARREGRNPESVRAPEIKDLADLTPKDAESIALALRELTGTPMMRDWVEVVRERAAGEVTVTATWIDVAAAAIPWQLRRDRTPDRMVIGMGRRGQDLVINPRRHWQIVGATGSGKTGLEWQFIAEGLIRGHVVPLGAAKTWTLLEEFLDVLPPGARLPMRVAVGLEDCLKMIVALLRIAEYRLALPAAQRRELTPIWAVLTESARVLPDQSRTITWQGAPMTVGALIGLAMRTTLEAEIYWITSAQDYDHDYWGREAGSVKNNSGTVLVRSRSADERRRALGDAYYSWPDHQYPGEVYVAEAGEQPQGGKAAYIQQSSKPRLHDGLTATDLAPILAGQAREFTREEIDAAGAWFASRPQVMTPAYRDYLRGVASAETGAGADAVGDPTADLLAQADAAVEAWTRRELPAATPPEVDLVAQVTGLPPVTDRAAQLVAAAGTMGRADVLAGLLAEGYSTTQGSVDNILGRLVAAGRVERVPHRAGLYRGAGARLTSPAPSPVYAGRGEGPRVK